MEKTISTSEEHAKYPFPGQNTQHINFDIRQVCTIANLGIKKYIVKRKNRWRKKKVYLNNGGAECRERYVVIVRDLGTFNGHNRISGRVETFRSCTPDGDVDLGKAFVHHGDVTLAQLLKQIRRGFNRLN